VTVIGITGHRELSASTEELVVAAQRGVRSASRGELVGVSALADEADTVLAHAVFARTVLDVGGAVIVVIPARCYRDIRPSRTGWSSTRWWTAPLGWWHSTTRTR
jgi:hypothetical protein